MIKQIKGHILTAEFESESKIEIIFPTCRTCKFFNPNEYIGCVPYCDMMDMVKDSALYCSDQVISIRNPDKFFCSEHEIKEGQRFVNWDKK